VILQSFGWQHASTWFLQGGRIERQRRYGCPMVALAKAQCGSFGLLGGAQFLQTKGDVHQAREKRTEAELCCCQVGSQHSQHL